jgi:5'-3' exonuclease
MDESGVQAKFGVLPKSIPDYLALVGDSADGYPGLQRWGAKSASAVLARYLHLEHIPEDANSWEVRVAGAKTLASTLALQREQALLFRTLATLRCDIHLFHSVDALKWNGFGIGAAAMAQRLQIEDRLTNRG